MQYKYSLFSILIMMVVGVTTSITFFSWRPQNVSTTRSSLRADAIMEDVSAVIMDKFGKPKMKIVSPRMLHFAENDTTQLLDPELTLYRKSPTPWFIKSRYAKATQGIENVNFWENVTIHHAADENNPSTLIKTPTLTVLPNKQTASTTDFITMEQPNLIVKATGMHADMNTGDIRLLSDARGEYVPNS